MTEKEAQEVVAEARQCTYIFIIIHIANQTISYEYTNNYIFLFIDRAQKLKAAKTDASAEVDAYKAKKDAELKKFEENVSFKFILIILRLSIYIFTNTSFFLN
ncbi:hypothetical protein B5S27_g4049 [[Candida] boidinii]|nr:hypothetical protein B5S27_g4049 [[Candida] boidinii]